MLPRSKWIFFIQQTVQDMKKTENEQNIDKLNFNKFVYFITLSKYTIFAIVVHMRKR